MRSATHRSRSVLIVALLFGLLAITPTTAQAQPAPPGTPAPPPPCSNRVTPPPPIDTSEQPAPGNEMPEPLPVPQSPVGGQRMDDCAVVLPSAAHNPPPETTAMSWVVQDLDSGDVLAARDAHARHRPASLIKTLLALVVINEFDQDKLITVTPEDAAQECTCVGIVAGAQYTVDTLLHGLLMHSGNDVAHAFATALGGVPQALEKMNALAQRIGAADTRAATTSGLDGPGMSTSAYDLSLIFHHAMRQPAFSDPVATQRMEFPGRGGAPAIPLINDNKLLESYPGFLGGKTGFTDDARHTYVGGAQQDGRRLAVVLVRAEQDPTPVSEQAASLLDYGFALAGNETEPVGHIVQNTDEPDAPDSAGKGAPGPGSSAASTQPDESSGSSFFPVTLAILAGGLAGLIIVRRNRRRDS